MRRIILMVSVAVFAIAPSLASDTLRGLGYSLTSFPADQFRISGIGIEWTGAPTTSWGVYWQLMSYFGGTAAMPWWNYAPNPIWGPGGVGLNCTIGYGRKLAFQRSGWVFGGGVSTEAFAEVVGGLGAVFVTGGLGAGVRYYHRTQRRSRLFNLGVDVAWRPLGYSRSFFLGYGFWFLPSTVNATFSIGLRSVSAADKNSQR